MNFERLKELAGIESLSKEVANEAANTEVPKVLQANGEKPVNVIDASDAVFTNPDDNLEFQNKASGAELEQESKVKVPNEVIRALDKRIGELKKSIDDYDNNGYDQGSVKPNAVEVLEKLKSHLQDGSVEAFKQAQIYYGHVDSVIQQLLPSSLINFLHSGKQETKFSLT